MGSRPGDSNWNLAADIYPVTTAYPPTTDNIVGDMDMELVIAHMGEKGQFYEHTTDLYPSFSYIEEEVMRCQDVVLCLGFYQDRIRDGGHFVTVAGVNSTASQYQLLISNPIRDDFEAGVTPAGRSPVPHVHGPEPPYTTHNNASLVSQDAWTVKYNAAEGYWYLEGYFSDSTWEARIEFAVITSPSGIHDIKVTDISPFKTVVGQKYLCPINVTVLNEGDFTETFDLTLYAFTMLPETPIETKTVSDLLSGEKRTISFIWNTTGWSRGNYTIRAYAWPVLGETDTEDNTFTDGWVKVVIPGNVNGDTIVDMKDITAILRAYGTTPGQPKWNSNCDVNGDGIVDMKDVTIALRNYGKTE